MAPRLPLHEPCPQSTQVSPLLADAIMDPCVAARTPHASHSYDTASRQELLRAMQITDILNVRRGRPQLWV
jgi:hypothetical protein